MEPGVPTRRLPRPEGLRISTRLAHCLIITTNIAQLLLIILFLSLMLIRLDGVDVAWAAVFAPLWISDMITLSTGAHEVARLVRPMPSEPIRRNLLIMQVNRLKGTLCTAVFKVLVVLRLSDPEDTTPARVIIIPFYVCAAGRLFLHTLKEKVPSSEPSSPPKRPGAPLNPLHIFILLIACRIDGLNDLSWAATFWPMWIVFGMLGLTLLGAIFLGVGICVTGEPRENGQRALFAICFGVLLTITTCGFAFQLNLTNRLDGDESISNAAIITPLICAYGGLLLFYLAFTFVLPRIVEYDIAAMTERIVEEEDQRDGVLEAVSQQLAPPFLVQTSSTLFQRVNSTMMSAFLTPGSAADRRESGAAAEDGAEAASPASGGAPAPAPAPAPTPAAQAHAPEARGDGGDGGLNAMEEGWADGPGPVLTEFEELQTELSDWLRNQQPPHNSSQLRAEAFMADSPWGIEEAGEALDEASRSDGDAEAGADGTPADSSNRRADVVDEHVDDAADAAGDGGADVERELERERAAAPAAARADAPAGAVPAESEGSSDGAAEPPASAPEDGAVSRSPAAAPSDDAAAPSPASEPAAQADGAAPAAADAAARPPGSALTTLVPVPPIAAGSTALSPSVRGAGPVHVPPDIVQKLHRFVALRQQIVSRAVATALVDLQDVAEPSRAAAAPVDETKTDAAPAAAAPSIASRLSLPGASRRRAQTRATSTLAERRCSAAVTATATAAASRDSAGAAKPVAAAGEKAAAAAPAADVGTDGDAVAADGADDEDVSEIMCWICCEGPRDAVFLECGHGGVCLACAKRCWKKRGRLCPMCRQGIEQVVHIAPQAADYQGARIVRVREADPAAIESLEKLQAATTASPLAGRA